MCVNTSACCKTLHPAKSANKFARSALTLPIKYDDNNDGCDVKRWWYDDDNKCDDGDDDDMMEMIVITIVMIWW